MAFADRTKIICKCWVSSERGFFNIQEEVSTDETAGSNGKVKHL